MEGEAGGDNESPKLRSLRGKYLRSRAKSHSDISQPPSDESLPPSPQPLTEPSSPYKRILGFKSGKRIHNVINTLRRLAPQKLRHRTKEYSGQPKGSLQNRLSSSHPNVSTTDLAAVAKSSCDDSAVGMSSGSMAITDAASYSDPTIHRNSAGSHELLACANDFRHASNNHRLKDTDDIRDSGITIDSVSHEEGMK